LGPFIATFQNQRVDPKLLMFYRTMPHPSKHGRDSDIAYYCAHNFPAVLLTLGGQRWAERSDLYMLLVKDLQWKVRRTLAYSLHEVAKIVGPQVTERALLSVFNGFLADLEEVKIGVVTHFAEFLAQLGPEQRANYGHVIRNLEREDFGSWRFRELVACQMAGMFLSFELLCCLLFIYYARPLSS
jgi:serine/threonine-protein phosphatase 4 regulatory subunit 1